MDWRRNLVAYLYSSKHERKGVLTLILLILLFQSLTFLKEKAASRTQPDFSYLQQAASAYHLQQKADSLIETEKIPKEDSLFAFNPNEADEKTLITLGIPPRTASTLIKYRLKGGNFKEKEDLKKIYGFPDSLYEKLESFIQLQAPSPPRTLDSLLKPVDPNTASREQLQRLGISRYAATNLVKYREKGGHYRSLKDIEKIYGFDAEQLEIARKYFDLPDKTLQTTPLEIDVNMADSDTWQELHGIGPSYAGRILKFRDKLGGFLSVDQIRDTWGLPDSVFQQIKPHLKWSPIFRKIPVQTATVDELKAHPYISYKQAYWIHRYRSLHGPTISPEILISSPLFDEESVKKLMPYLEFELKDD